ncbi:hypothetical protein DBV05_g11881 [Lasiodiplodia theobromae]|uniref:RNase H type-1 domain-containing protein n=1 Tax=Lasiodiplodia theobromae TaxID=45133 RepID=A0A5N5CVS2_9PEZI|nr:hypothetical protein DBV05_g11881 [Lasiodiplodia theobromae]
MTSTDQFLATVCQADHRIHGTQQTRSFKLLVHADRLPSGQLDYDGSVAFAHRAADHKYTLVMYGDGSGNYQDPRSPQWTGVAAAWKRKDEPLYHVVGRTIKRRMVTDEMELQAVNECMDTAFLERWDVEQQVIVMTDNIYALQAIKDWIPGQGGRNESALRRLKHYDDLFAEQGVPVAVRYLKGRRYVEGHDTADVWARQLATTMHHVRFSPVPEYQDQERLVYKKIWLWMLTVNESRENNKEMKRWIKSVRWT